MPYQSPLTAYDSDIEVNDARSQDYYSNASEVPVMENSSNEAMLKKMDLMMSLLENMGKRMAEQEKRIESQDEKIVMLKRHHTNKGKNKDNDDCEDEENEDGMDIDSVAPGNGKRPRHRTGDIKQFNGERSEWISWRTEAQTKLRIDGNAIGNEEEKFGYLYMHMSVAAQKRIQQWYNLRLKLGTDCTPAAFFERAEGTFGDPNERKNALTLLEVIKQRKDESFSDFVTRFEELLAQAGGEDWAMDLQVNALEKSLNSEMQSRLVSYPLPDPSYNTFRSACLTIDAKLQAMKTWTRNASASVAPKIIGGSGGSKDSLGKSRGDDRVDNRERAPWVSGEERERRRNLGLCLRCGGANHRQKGCRLRSAIDPNNGSGKVRVSAVNVEDSVDNTSDFQGKV